MRSLLTVALCAALAAPAGQAGSYSISPVRLQLSAARSITLLTVQNNDAEPLVVQVRPFSWNQVHEEDQLSDTDELLVTPPIFTLPPHGAQIVRIAGMRAIDAAHERAFRIELDEIPGPAPPGFNGLRVALRVTLPLFLVNGHAAEPRLNWRHHRLASGPLEVRSCNQGSVHAQILGFELQPAGGAAALHTAEARYLLPGACATWQLAAPASAWEGEPLRVHAISDAGELDARSLAVAADP